MATTKVTIESVTAGLPTGGVVTVDGVNSRIASRGVAFVDHVMVATVLLEDGRRVYGEACYYLAWHRNGVRGPW